MKFQLTKTSSYEGKPHRKAKKEKIVRIDERTTDDPSKIPSGGHTSDWWYKDGRNHRVENGRIKRDFDAEIWVIEINSLEDLIAFGNKCGTPLVVGTSYLNASMPSIEIYDDYRE